MQKAFELISSGEAPVAAHILTGAELDRTAAMWGLYRRSRSASSPQHPEADTEFRGRLLKDIAARAGIAAARARGVEH